jgi:hypothetical protein
MHESKGESLPVVKNSKPPSPLLTAKGQLIKDWLVKFSLNANEELDDFVMQGYQQMWEEAFVGLELRALQAAFAKTLRACKFFPKVADILEHVEQAKQNGDEEQAALKWDEVIGKIRRNYHPDLGGWCGGKIAERTRRAINCAGGMAYLSECVGDNLVFARKRFIESWLRWDELQQDQYLLPEGEFKKLIADASQRMTIPQIPEQVGGGE